MKRVLKLFVVIFILNQCFAYADFIKPDAKIKPEEVIKIQLKSLMKNDAPCWLTTVVSQPIPMGTST